MSVTEHRTALQPVTKVFRDAGVYAYGTVDDQNRWCIAADVEDGHIDVRIGLDGYEMDAWSTLTGMFVDEENDRRRAALERLARVSIPAIQRGFLDDTEVLFWDDVEKGIALRKTVNIPFSATERLPEIAMQQLADVNSTLLFLSKQINS